MAINFDAAIGVHASTLDFRVERTKVLAGNLANAETPGYKAKDLDFSTTMQRIEQGRNSRQYSEAFRIPHQPSADGNTVELGQEQARFAQNSMDFQTSLTFLNMKIGGLKQAIEGR